MVSGRTRFALIPAGLVLAGFLTFQWARPHLDAVLTPPVRGAVNDCGELTCRPFFLVVKNTGHWQANSMTCTVAIEDAHGAVIATVTPQLGGGSGPGVGAGDTLQMPISIAWPPGATKTEVTCHSSARMYP